MAGYLERFLDLVETYVLKDSEEVNTLKKILALSIYWDKVVCESELAKAIEILETKLKREKFTGTEIDLVINDFRDLVKEYQTDEEAFILGKKWMWESLENGTILEEYFEIIKEIFSTDGCINQAEQSALNKLIEKMQRGK